MVYPLPKASSRIRLLILLSLSGVWLTGCALTSANKTVKTAAQCDLRPVAAAQGQAPVNGPVLVPMIPGSVQVMPLDAVNLTDPNITHKVIVHSTQGSRSDFGALMVSSRLLNCTDHDLALEGRTHFMDANQRDVEAPTGWKTLFIPAGSFQTYETVSLSTDAQRYLVEMREKR